MLRNLLIISASGLVLFSKEFVNAISQSRLVGSLIAAMLEFSAQNTGGLPVSYIELSNVAVSIVTAEESKASCALFHDVEDGPDFGRLLAGELLRAFVTEYARDLDVQHLNLKEFQGFSSRISEVIRNSVRPILDNLGSHRGIQMALLVTNEWQTYSTCAVDKLGVVANIQSMLNLANDLMSAGNDAPYVMTLESVRTRLLVRRLEHGYLVVMCRKNVQFAATAVAVRAAISILDRVFLLMANLQPTG
mmetsp:Transcript_9224/g.15163  ORF Transcript_9224/g.15163 Transcript_9224/m.15163 type:complete len:248 (-) Transcript_9224:386-1129(-)|eukprot:CAMPEP_0184656338 /NCGR_PEP_ID=MMETSP0308-20130426/16382_1 /TAXON_ID=38269 /ORGANISM="Gloeochaete witrockiana, Strain SAG 46.84" /LENGTH=247 /DNA_ID=CAMNT_0027093413 /DNA_START=190 /DNA_END=933 /DNA_ORIENTATION=-